DAVVHPFVLLPISSLSLCMDISPITTNLIKNSRTITYRKKKGGEVLSWLDHGDGHVVDGVRLGRRIGPHRQRGLVRRRGLLRAREQRRLLGRRQLRLVADEHQHHAGHGRPELRALLHAQQARVVAPPRLLLGVRPGQRRVHELRRLVLAPHPPCVLDERVLVLLEVHCAVALAAEDLQHQHPEAVHVRLHREDAPHRVLRRHVPVCSDDVAGVDNLDLLVLEDHGHAEVGDLGVHLVVEEHVAGLEVPVHDLEARVLVEVQQPARDPHHDALPHLPVQVRRLSRTEEEGVEAPVGEVLVDEHLLVLVHAAPQQPHQVPVLQLGDQLHLVPELRRALPRPRRQPLHRDLRAAVQHAPVDGPEAAFAELVLLGETVGGGGDGGQVHHRQVRVGEWPQPL
uniref:Uncharacterized protein n=2 Tax=Aegilops tauschii subsp. strangulata TaxID=200361 RepID=A0A453PDI1_AEGTS